MDYTIGDEVQLNSRIYTSQRQPVGIVLTLPDSAKI